MPKGYHSFVLHAHLPFVRHPEHEEFLEESWLFEAVTETYIPLLEMMEHLSADGIRWRLTMSLTPPLCEMLADPLLQERYLRHLGNLTKLADAQVRSQPAGTPFHDTAVMYRDHFHGCKRVFEDKFGRNLLGGFKQFMEAGNLEIISCPATHGFLPLMATREAARAQILTARKNYEKHFGRPPRGIWLSECGYKSEIDELLAECDIDYFFLDTHGVVFGEPRPKYGPYRPVYCPSGVAVFARDPESGNQVWSAESGYPGDPLYREFYRDLGWDADYNYIRPFLHSDGVRRDVGIKYYRITGKVDLHDKAPYDPARALDRARLHAADFVFNRRHQVRYLREVMGTEPLVISPYDAELFGHWWFEGPWFLEQCFRSMHDQDDFEPVTPPDILDKGEPFQVVQPSPSSWGDGGYNEVWLNPKNDWIYRHLHIAEKRMVELAERFPDAAGILRKALDQAARELLLAQSSDWAFIMTTGTMVSYAEKRTREHIRNFNGIYQQVVDDRIEEPWIDSLFTRHNIFAEMDYRVYRSAGGR